MPKQQRNSKPMSACERGNWIDTEGYIRPRHHVIEITQEEREPLEDYCAGARRDSVPCKVRKVTQPEWGEAYRAEIIGAQNVAKEIVLTQNCIRTRTRRAQIETFKKDLMKPRKTLRTEIITARQILGLPLTTPQEKRWMGKALRYMHPEKAKNQKTKSRI